MDITETYSWSKVDNVAKIFLATHGDRDTRTLRVCCTLNEPVDPETLQEALNAIVGSRNLFQVRIRRGLFWHYLEPTDEMPKVCEEYQRPCPVLYGKKHTKKLHYSVTYYKNRINVEMFHALTDGTGAIEFLNSIVVKYLKLKHRDAMKSVKLSSDGSATDLADDSYNHYYESESLLDTINIFEKFEKLAQGSEDEDAPPVYGKAYHIRGGKLPYSQLQFFEVEMNGKDIVKEAKAMGTSVSGLIGARLMMAIRDDMPASKKKLPVTISMPVNLRNFYPSETSRNFFVSISVSHVFTGDETEESLAKEFAAKMKACLKPNQIKEKMNGFQKFEHWFIVRMIPLAIKQPFLKYMSKFSARKVSGVISNLGVIKLPEEMRPYVKNYTALCSHSELFMTVASYGDKMTFGITSCYKSTSAIKSFVRGFSKNNTDVTINATEVIRL